jgi:hypothetical protein
VFTLLRSVYVCLFHLRHGVPTLSYKQTWFPFYIALLRVADLVHSVTMGFMNT